MLLQSSLMQARNHPTPQLLSYHITKGVVPASALKDGATIATLLPKETLKVAVDGKDVVLVHPKVELDPEDKDDDDDDEDHASHEGHHDDIELFDQTFEGPFRPSVDKYIVHGVDHVMVPPSAVAAVQKLRAGAKVCGERVAGLGWAAGLVGQASCRVLSSATTRHTPHSTSAPCRPAPTMQRRAERCQGPRNGGPPPPAVLSSHRRTGQARAGRPGRRNTWT
jgi:hypothetical protein